MTPPEDAAFPPPPPPIPAHQKDASPAAQAIFWLFFITVFGLPWRRAVGADWLAAEIAAGAALGGLFFLDLRPWLKKISGLALFCAMMICVRFIGRAQGTAAADSPPFEVLVPTGFGLAAGLAALYLGLGASSRSERGWAAGLVLSAAAALTLAGLSMRQAVSPAGATLSGILASEWNSWISTGGPRRWAGPVVLSAVAALLRYSRGEPLWGAAARPKAAILNWNR